MMEWVARMLVATIVMQDGKVTVGVTPVATLPLVNTMVVIAPNPLTTAQVPCSLTLVTQILIVRQHGKVTLGVTPVATLKLVSTTVEIAPNPLTTDSLVTTTVTSLVQVPCSLTLVTQILIVRQHGKVTAGVTLIATMPLVTTMVEIAPAV
jgi:hypothetical protein